MEISFDIEKVVFLFLLDIIGEKEGAKKAKEILQKIGEDIGKALLKRYQDKSLESTSFLKFKETPNPITSFDTTLEISNEPVFLLNHCPFEEISKAYKSITGSIPRLFKEITDIYNEEGNGTAISPYCIVHQAFRSVVGSHIKIKDVPYDIIQLGCKAPTGAMRIASKNLKIANTDENSVREKLAYADCVYVIKKK